MKVKSFSCVRLLATPWTAAYQASPSMGFSRQEYWSGMPLPSPKSSIKNKLIFEKRSLDLIDGPPCSGCSVDLHTCLLRNLYVGQKGTVRTARGKTDSKSGKEYVRAVYCLPAYLTYMQSTSRRRQWRPIPVLLPKKVP